MTSTPIRSQRRPAPLAKLILFGVVMAMVAAACSGSESDTTTTDAQSATASTTGASTSSSAGATTGTTEAATTTTTAAVDNRTGVELSMATWFYVGAYEAKYNADIEAFVSNDARVDGVTPEILPFDRIFDVLNVQLAGGSPPDTVWLQAGRKDEYIEAGVLVDLAPIIAEKYPDYDLDDFPPHLLEPWRRGDAIYGIPAISAAWILAYNKDIFDAAGVPTPHDMIADGTWTWENLMATAKAVVDSGDAAWGFQNVAPVFSAGFPLLQEYWNDHGARAFSEDGSTCLFTSPETISSTQAYHDMIFRDEASPGPGVAASFAAGDIAMSATREALLNQLADADFGWDVAPMPSGPAGWIPEIGGYAITAFNNGANPDIAGEFAVFTMTKEQAGAPSISSPSARLSLLTLDTLAQFNPIMTAEQIETALLPTVTADTAELVWSHIAMGPIISHTLPIFDGQVWVPDADIPAAMEAACNQIAPFLGS